MDVRWAMETVAITKDAVEEGRSTNQQDMSGTRPIEEPRKKSRRCQGRDLTVRVNGGDQEKMKRSGSGRIKEQRSKVLYLKKKGHFTA